MQWDFQNQDGHFCNHDQFQYKHTLIAIIIHCQALEHANYNFILYCYGHLLLQSEIIVVATSDPAVLVS